jgi:hypothetical protein
LFKEQEKLNSTVESRDLETARDKERISERRCPLCLWDEKVELIVQKENWRDELVYAVNG